jgi:hypothetical protein
MRHSKAGVTHWCFADTHMQVNYLLEFIPQGISLKFWHIVKKKLMHPKRGRRKNISPSYACPIEQEEIPCHAMPPPPGPQL